MLGFGVTRAGAERSADGGRGESRSSPRGCRERRLRSCPAAPSGGRRFPIHVRRPGRGWSDRILAGARAYDRRESARDARRDPADAVHAVARLLLLAVRVRRRGRERPHGPRAHGCSRRSAGSTGSSSKARATSAGEPASRRTAHGRSSSPETSSSEPNQGAKVFEEPRPPGLRSEVGGELRLLVVERHRRACGPLSSQTLKRTRCSGRYRDTRSAFLESSSAPLKNSTSLRRCGAAHQGSSGIHPRPPSRSAGTAPCSQHTTSRAEVDQALEMSISTPAASAETASVSRAIQSECSRRSPSASGSSTGSGP